MTPLAHRLVKELTLPIKRRTVADDARLLRRMDDIHCFDCSAVLEVVDDLVASSKGDAGIGNDAACFLPAPKTWLEWIVEGKRFGVLLEEMPRKTIFRVTLAIDDGNEAPVTLDVGYIEVTGNTPTATYTSPEAESINAKGALNGILRGLPAMLAIINTPRIIGRRQHMPHRGLERRLANARHIQGSFPLHAWTEITLAVSPPRDASSDASIEAHLTGVRALHFCRAHLRMRLGRLEVVRAHWRGDASVGIRQSRYKLAA